MLRNCSHMGTLCVVKAVIIVSKQKLCFHSKANGFQCCDIHCGHMPSRRTLIATTSSHPKTAITKTVQPNHIKSTLISVPHIHHSITASHLLHSLLCSSFSSCIANTTSSTAIIIIIIITSSYSHQSHQHQPPQSTSNTPSPLPDTPPNTPSPPPPSAQPQPSQPARPSSP